VLAPVILDTNRFKQRAARELDTWSRLRHVNVLEFFGVAKFRGHVAMISPWMENDSVPLFLKNNPEFNRYIFVCVDSFLFFSTDLCYSVRTIG
jgi:serine/threonine protein kinase